MTGSVIQHLDWLFENKLINIMQYSRAKDETEIWLIDEQYRKTGFNRREEADG